MMTENQKFGEDKVVEKDGKRRQRSHRQPKKSTKSSDRKKFDKIGGSTKLWKKIEMGDNQNKEKKFKIPHKK